MRELGLKLNLRIDPDQFSRGKTATVNEYIGLAGKVYYKADAIPHEEDIGCVSISGNCVGNGLRQNFIRKVKTNGRSDIFFSIAGVYKAFAHDLKSYFGSETVPLWYCIANLQPYGRMRHARLRNDKQFTHIATRIFAIRMGLNAVHSNL